MHMQEHMKAHTHTPSHTHTTTQQIHTHTNTCTYLHTYIHTYIHTYAQILTILTNTMDLIQYMKCIQFMKGNLDHLGTSRFLHISLSLNTSHSVSIPFTLSHYPILSSYLSFNSCVLLSLPLSPSSFHSSLFLNSDETLSES